MADPGQMLYANCGYRLIRIVEVDLKAIGVEKGERWKKLGGEKLPVVT